jgi:GT2 family glycosyltransferase
VTGKPTFRVKPYAHSTYKFVVRTKLDGKWKRSYFKNEQEATAYAREKNAAASRQIDGGTGGSSVGQDDTPPNTLAGGAPNQRLAISPPAGARSAVVILGMHRSGTSALCGALDLVGVDFGDHLMPANDANVKGYWEHEEIVRVHDRLLSSLGSWWDDDEPLPSDWVEREATREARSQLLEILERDFAHSSLFGVKDPRMCRLMPLWLPIFPTLGVEPHFVVVVRHPWEVAESLAKRDGIEHPKSYLLWLEHVVQAESATRGSKRSFVRYEEMVDDPVAILTRLQKQLGVNLRAPSRTRDPLRNFLDPSLRHHEVTKTTAGQLRYPIPHVALDLFGAIQNASTPKEISRKVAPLAAEFLRARELFPPGSIRAKKLSVALQSTDHDLPGALEQAQVTSSQPSAELQQRNEEVSHRDTQLSQFSSELEAAEARKREYETQLDIDARRITSLGTDVDGLKRELETASARASDLSLQRETERARSEERVAEIERQRSAAEAELQASRDALGTSRDETARRLGVLEIQRTHNVGVAASQAKLEARFAEVSRRLLGLGAELQQQGNSHAPGIISAILEDIRRIHHPSFSWKVARSLGLLRLAPPGTPRSASELRSIAHELKARLREIRKTLASGSSAPEDVAYEISRLLELRRRARAMAGSLRLSTLLRSAGPVWDLSDWPLRPSSNIVRESGKALLFEGPWYLGHNPDVAAAEIDPLDHYLKWGAAEGRNPNSLFDLPWYLARSPDVAEAELSALKHYCEWGAQEGRDPSPLFSTNWYLAQNPDVAAAGLNPLAHYLEHGAREGRDPHPLFDTSWYLAHNPEVSGLNPLEHYLRWGCHHRRSPHPLFDATWYLAQYDDVAAAKIDPLLHYLDIGWREGRDPHPLFDSSWYLEQNPDLRGELNPLRHYLEFGGPEGRDPHPLFDSGHYLGTYLKDPVEKPNPLVHYLTTGWRLGYQPNPQFDPSLYLHVHPDVAGAGIEPFTHYILSGKTEGRVSTADEISFEPYKPDFEIPREPALPPENTAADVKAIAFYLPQFHRIPENDAWWGEGFTEWSNVRRGHPNFEGHYQPHVPSALGYYDLSEESVLERQAQLARQAGIHGFCYHYYWFGGKVLLDLPIRRIVERGKPDFPFCICWANENWTRRWDGKESEILIAQRHSPDDDLAFIQKIEPVLRQKNYIRIDGKPMLLIYRPSLLPDAKATLERWRSYARRVGLGDLHLVIVYSFSEQRSAEFYGFDAAVQFPPHLQATPVTPRIPGRSWDFTGFIYDYTEVRRYALQQFASTPEQTRLYPGVMPSWDNTARQRTRSTIWVNSSPEAYYEWLAEASRLVRAKSSQSDHLVFINAWNEWAEGCHLEPDDRYGYAWLNATSLALRQGPLVSPEPVALAAYPPAPPEVPVVVQPLSGLLKLVISVLFYHREDILTAFITSLLPQLKLAAHAEDLSCELFLSFNYEPSSETLSDLRKLIAQLLPSSADSVHIIENRFNLGFGAGHNAIFERTASDVFIVLNSDLHIEDEHWLSKFVDRFRDSDVAILGLAGNASRLREDGCGIPVGETGAAFDFVDGSVLAIRSDLAARFGLFAPSFDYFYFEDVDLNLRYRQMGLRIETLDLPCLHERSSSTQLLPKFAVESVLNRNRARFFERWGRYLTTRCLMNRLALRYRDADRQLQCASLAAIFGLLAEHPTAVLDLWGVHEQVVPLFQHPRIRVIPWWQTQRPEDYLRSYELSLDGANPSPLAVRIAEQMLVEPAFESARHHLESLLSRDALDRAQTKGAVIYLTRPQILFEGKQPGADSLLAAQAPLLRKGFAIRYHSEYGLPEIPAVPPGEQNNWKYVAWSTGLDLLKDLALAEVLVTSDGWAAELGQLLNKRTLLWLGATSAEAAIWNTATTHPFLDPSLSCLGCHERFGQTGRNVCLRGDEACMSSRLTETFVQSLEKFLDGERVATGTMTRSSANAVTSRIKLSEQEKLEAWPETSAGSVLVLTPLNPTLDPAVLRRARELAERAIGGMRGCRIVYDDTGEAPARGSTFPHRLAAMTPLRKAMIDRHLRNEKWVFWVDADLVDYPANLVEELISRAEGGIAAPLVLMEGEVSEPAYPAGFGPGRFYDIAGFIENSRWARFTQPYFDQPGPVYRLDSVGCCYLVNADLYRWGAKHELDHASRAFIAENRVWPDDAIAQNQSGPANSFTDHYSVCEFARKVGLPVQAFGDLIAYHKRA